MRVPIPHGKGREFDAAFAELFLPLVHCGAVAVVLAV